MYPYGLATADLRQFRNAGTPSNGTNEISRITQSGTPTGGTFDLIVPGSPLNQGGLVNNIAYNSTMATWASNVQTAINAAFGAGTVSVASNTGTSIDITWLKTYSGMPIGLLQVLDQQLTGGLSPVLTPTVQTPGVLATGRGCPNGTLLWDTTNMIMYVNVGDETTTTWGQMSGALTGAGAPTNGVTGAGIAPPGSIYTRTSNAAIYVNTNTLASPTWTINNP